MGRSRGGLQRGARQRRCAHRPPRPLRRRDGEVPRPLRRRRRSRQGGAGLRRGVRPLRQRVDGERRRSEVRRGLGSRHRERLLRHNMRGQFDRRSRQLQRREHRRAQGGEDRRPARP
ncbi:MAG: hypothetical protein WC483_05005 [Candidatus Paceibacterota bacterium]